MITCVKDIFILQLLQCGSTEHICTDIEVFELFIETEILMNRTFFNKVPCNEVKCTVLYTEDFAVTSKFLILCSFRSE